MHYRSITLSLLFLLCTLPLSPMWANNGHDHESEGTRVGAAVQGTPQLKFIENKGQWEGDFRYRTDLTGGRLWLENQGFTYSFQDVDEMNRIHEYYYHGDPQPGEFVDNEVIDCHAFKVNFLGSQANPGIGSTGPSEGYYNFFLGDNPANWASDLHAYDKVRYYGLYQNVDMEVYSTNYQLKYDFLVLPNGDPSQIRLEYEGMDALFLRDGDLVIQTSVAELKELKPYAYQMVNGQETEVVCQFVLLNDVLSFEFPYGYDNSLELVIDPTLVAATYSGSTAGCYGHTATYDDNENIYSGGICFGQGFPVTTGAFQVTFGGNIDQAINKYNPDATALIWSTYVGGSSSDYPHSLVVNAQEELTILGTTGSSDFPVSTNAFDASLGGSNDIVLTHLNTAATGIIGSTYLGGSNSDGRNLGNLYFNYGDTYRGEVIYDSNGDILVSSVTQSSDFPITTGAFQTTFGGSYDGVVVRMAPNLATMVWGSFIGGTNDDNANSIKVNSTGDIYIVGIAGDGFPVTTGAYQTTHGGGQTDGYIARISSNGQTLNAATYLGTLLDDAGFFIEIDNFDFPYVLGQSPNYPVSPNVYSMANGEIFIEKLEPNLNASIWSTVIGGTSNLSPTAFLVDNCGNIYSSSWGTTTGLPFTPNAYDNVGGGEFYLCALTPDAGSLLYGTSFGANSGDHVDGGTCRFDKRGVVYESVCTASSAWPVTPGAVFPTDPNSGFDVTSFKFAFELTGVQAAFASFSPSSGCSPYPLVITNNSTQNATTNYFWDFGDGTTSNLHTPSHTYTQAGTYNIMLIVNDGGTCNGIDTAYSQVIIDAPPIISVTLDTTTCFGSGVELETINLPGVTYAWSPGLTLTDSTVSNPIANPTVTTTYTLIVTGANGCADTAEIDVNVFQLETDAGPAVSFCEGEGGTQLQAGPLSGGTAPYYYTWWCDSTNTFCGLDSTFDDDPVANPDTTVWYYLQVTDADGCIGTIDSAMVTVLPKPIVDAGGDVDLCPLPSPGSVLNASVVNSNEAPGPYTVNWFPATGLNDATIFNPYARPDTTTIYACIVSSSNGCTSTATTIDTTSTITVVVNPLPVADAGPDLHLCYGDSLQLQGIGSAAGPNYSFEWSPVNGISDSAAANPSVSPALTTDYTLTVWSNGCPSFGDPVTVWVHTLPTPSAGNIQEICLGESANLDAFADGDSSALYSYNWWPQTGLNDHTLENPAASPDSTTLYYLVATSSWGCESALDSVQVTVVPTPLAEAGVTLEICESDSIQLQGSYYYSTTGPVQDPSQIYYNWSPNTSMSDSDEAQPWVWPGNSTVYYLQVDHGNCSTLDSVLVTVNPEVNPLVYADTSITCEGDSVQLHALGGLGSASFHWIPSDGLSDPNAPEPMAAPSQTTVYSLVAEEGGCISNDGVTLEIIPLPDVSYLNSLEAGCAPYTVSFLDNSSDVINYIWDFGDGTSVSNEASPVHEYADPGQYTVTLTGINTGGCAAEASNATIDVVAPAAAEFALQSIDHPQINRAPMELFVPGANVKFTDESEGSPVRWAWDFGDGNVSTLQHPVFEYRKEGIYMVQLQVWNEMGCVSEISHGPIVINLPELFIPNVFSPNGDLQNDRYLVEYNGSQPFFLEIYDRWGNLHYQSQNKTQGWQGVDLKGKSVPEGVYYYRLRIGDREFAGDLSLVR